MLHEVDWDKFEFRCHYFGDLMTKVQGKSNMDKYNDAVKAHDTFAESLMARSKSPTDNMLIKLNDLEKKMKELELKKDIPLLSNTCKKRLCQIYTEETTGRVKDIESLYIEKGLQTEEDSITLYSLRTGLFYRKNKERIGNGFINGEIDFDDEEKDMVIDTKSTWDIFTFDGKIAVGPSNLNFWQGQCYMWLKNRKNFRLAWCLNNTPNEILNRLIQRMRYNFIGNEDDWQQAVELLKSKHTYDDLPLERKIRIYDFKRDDEKIELAKTMIPHFRNYLKNITNSKFEEDGEISEETE